MDGIQSKEKVTIQKTIRSRVLLYGCDPYATVFLKQRGISYAPFRNDDRGEAGSIVWVLEAVRESDVSDLKRFQLSGGNLLGAVSCLQKLVPFITTSLWIENIRSDTTYLFSGISNLLMKMRGVRIHDAQYGATNDQYPSIAVRKAADGAGMVIALPFDLRDIREQGACRKRVLFHDRVFDEMIVGRSYHLINRLLFNCLCELSSAVGRTFVTRSLFPEPAAGGISFRIDADYYHEAGWESLIRLFAGHEKHTTVFMNTWSHRYHHDFIRRLQSLGFDIQSHMHLHAGFDDYRRNRSNIRRSAAVLKKLGIEATGSAAPYGLWNSHYVKGLEDAGFTFSTEFGYAYLDLPARTVVDGSRVSHIVHCCVFPLALEQFLAGSDKAFCDRFIEYVRSEIARGNHISVYLHPNSGVVSAYNTIRYVLEMLYQMDRCWFGSLSDLQQLYVRYEQSDDESQTATRSALAFFSRGGVRVFPGEGNGEREHTREGSMHDPWVELDYNPVITMTSRMLVKTILIAIKAWFIGRGYMQRMIYIQEAFSRMLMQLKEKKSVSPCDSF